ncbi:prepilin-type N-terminal cleavage/methylation domain-containing protein [Azospirillum sp. B4]|uniref:prepilin-type N-terminal cleavage/methylation domain-containing protein n=1 Tax=Azospirillum sp. B4 TaxID=95605 RepID=UPI000345736E|nr:prepilin-type N-terminal cleavage/methylation domain-containing protein [Azospirillum sp. B4]
MRNAGFTLVEILVVLAIIGMTGSVLALGLQRRLPGLRLEAAVSALEEELRSRQADAVILRQETTFSLGDMQGGKGVAHGGRLRRIAAVDLQIVGADPSFPNTIRFLPGGWSQGGRLFLREAGQEKVILVDWPLGTVHTESRP